MRKTLSKRLKTKVHVGNFQVRIFYLCLYDQKIYNFSNDVHCSSISVQPRS